MPGQVDMMLVAFVRREDQMNLISRVVEVVEKMNIA